MYKVLNIIVLGFILFLIACKSSALKPSGWAGDHEVNFQSNDMVKSINDMDDNVVDTTTAEGKNEYAAQQLGKSNGGTGAESDKADDGDTWFGNSSDGTGEYEGSGDGIFGRKVIYRDNKASAMAVKMAPDISGTVIMKICVDRAGRVTFAEVLPMESTITDRETLQNYNKAAFGYKVQPDFKAPKEQCGKLTFKFDNSVNNKLKKLK